MIATRTLVALALRALIVVLSTPLVRFLVAADRLADNLASPAQARPVVQGTSRRESVALFVAWVVTGSAMVALAWWAV